MANNSEDVSGISVPCRQYTKFTRRDTGRVVRKVFCKGRTRSALGACVGVRAYGVGICVCCSMSGRVGG